MASKFKSGDRVSRVGITGPQGTVKKVRVEAVGPTLKESKEGQEGPGVTVTVLWVNGTTSHLVPEGLQKLA